MVEAMNAEPVLSITAQKKLDTAIRQHERKLDAEFEMRVREECKRRLDEISLPHYAKQLEELERSISSRKGIMDRTSYRKILLVCTPIECRRLRSNNATKKRFGYLLNWKSACRMRRRAQPSSERHHARTKN